MWLFFFNKFQLKKKQKTIGHPKAMTRRQNYNYGRRVTITAKWTLIISDWPLAVQQNCRLINLLNDSCLSIIVDLKRCEAFSPSFCSYLVCRNWQYIYV